MVDVGIFIASLDDAFKELRVQSNVLCKQDPDSYVARRQFGQDNVKVVGMGIFFLDYAPHSFDEWAFQNGLYRWSL